MRSKRFQLLAVVVLTFGVGLAVLIAGHRPLLGLDLQGGVSVVLQPVEDGEVQTDVRPESIDQAIEILRNRVDAIGVAEPEISAQGNTILVQLPGIEDQQQALDLVGETAELRFRPVLQEINQETAVPLSEEEQDRVAELREKFGIPDGVSAVDIFREEQEIDSTPVPGDVTAPTTTTTTTTTTVPSESTTTTEATDTSVGPPASTTTAPAAGDEEALGGSGRGASRPYSSAAQDTDTTTDTDSTTSSTTSTTTTLPDNQYGVDTTDDEFIELAELEIRDDQSGVTPRADDDPEAEVVLPELDAEGGVARLYALGPVFTGADGTQLTGDSIERATSSLSGAGTWTVEPTFKSGALGIDLFNEASAACYAKEAVCPTGQLAIVLDGVVVTAPAINNASFDRSDIVISGESIDQERADSIAVALEYGALPLELEPQSVQTVSATIGEGALRAGIIAGLVGLGLTALYMLFYYRLLGAVSLAALTLATIQLLAIIAWLGETQGLALTLAGIVGIIVSIGVTLDSNVVYFEHIKEDVLSGRTVQSAVDRSFTTAWGTIVKADMASLIGAVVLYFLTVGPVRGFAFYLGLSTVLDLIVSYLFMRPLTIMLGQSARFRDRPRALGLSLPEAPGPVRNAPAPAGGDL